MTEPEDIPNRVTRLEHEMHEVKADAKAARLLAAGADRDVSKVESALRAHNRTLEALRETQLESRTEMREGFAKVDERFVSVDEHFVKVDEKLAKFDAHFAKVDRNFVIVNRNFAKVDEGFARVDEGFAEMRGRFAIVEQGLGQITALLTQERPEPDDV